MAEERKKRRYDSTRRQAQARETRQQILTAARSLFITRGFSGTTIEAIAQEAGVAVETVYVSFGNKRTLLAQLVDRAVGGDDEPIQILDRPAPQQVKSEPDQRRQLHMFARDMADIMERVGPLFGVMRAAATTEPEIAALLERLLGARRDNIGTFVQWLAHHGPLRPGLSNDEATDTAWSLTSAEVHHLLTVDRGWSKEHYSQWLGDTLVLVLLP
jgi:TetR/AcrR family transcriptional regulator of autoinduction and epiphytic fitness